MTNRASAHLPHRSGDLGRVFLKGVFSVFFWDFFSGPVVGAFPQARVSKMIVVSPQAGHLQVLTFFPSFLSCCLLSFPSLPSFLPSLLPFFLPASHKQSKDSEQPQKQKATKANRSLRKSTQVTKSQQKPAKTNRSEQQLPEATKSHQKPTKATRSHQNPTEANKSE